jgi:periplasmic copper chaperone A
MIMISSSFRNAFGAAILFFSSFSGAQSHVVLETTKAEAGAIYKAVLRVMHGCHGLATTKLEVALPEGLLDAKPMPKPGWTIAIAKGPYAKSYSLHHHDVSEDVKSITWNGGTLPDDEYDEFVFIAHIASDIAPGSTVYFPVAQSCGDQIVHWADVPQGAQSAAHLETPAPGLRIVADASEQVPPASVVTVGSLDITTPWLRATLPGAKVAGGYLRITNKGSEPDRLISASIPQAQPGAIHEMAVENGVALMSALPDGLEIKPDSTVELKPHGYHIMFEDLKAPLQEGETVRGTLTFAKAGRVPVTFKVGGIAESMPPNGSMEEMHAH